MKDYAKDFDDKFRDGRYTNSELILIAKNYIRELQGERKKILHITKVSLDAMKSIQFRPIIVDEYIQQAEDLIKDLPKK